MGQGEIYKVTCPEGKIYIGKCVQYLKSGEKYGTNRRWTGHLSDSRSQNGGRCRRLNEAIRRHNEKGFRVDVIRVVDESELGELERYYIAHFNARDPSIGYNIHPGGKHSRLPQETRERMRRSRLAYTLPPPSEETKAKISKTNIDKTQRKDYDGTTVLPKYVKYINWVDRKGYAIVSHPKCKLKYFVSTSKTLTQLYQQCIHYLSTL